jgi:hypothetical protein
LPYVEIQRAENEGEIIPLDIEFMPAEDVAPADGEQSEEI